MSESLPLTRVRVLDLTDGLGESAGRLLADLGADVVRVEAADGSSSLTAPPLAGETGIGYAVHNAGKQVVRLDLTSANGIEAVRALIDRADIVIDGLGAAARTRLGLDPASERLRRPALVWLSLTPFGPDGPYADRRADEAVLYAMSGVLSRSGVPGAPPLLPPRGLVEESFGVHAVWAALLAYYRRLRTGRGDYAQLSAFEAIVHGFDPGFGTQGSAAAGRTEDYPRGRPAAADFYPVFACRDGRVRMCLLAPRQWQAMFSWLGEPAEFADPKYATIPARFAAADRLNPLIGALFAQHTQQELVDEGARRGIPIGGVADLAEALQTEHYAQSGALIDAEIVPGHSARIPSGYALFDGVRAGYRGPARPAAVDAVWTQPHPEPDAAGQEASAPPLHGLKVLDLGVIVFGAELSRQLADYGADVIKVENSSFPDGLRQSKRGASIPASVIWGHRNKRSLGVNLRSEAGAELFRALVADADVVCANFKPGTLDSMGFSYEELRRINPRIVVSESSAFGATGPWRTRQGYGPLVRAASGVSALWSYPDAPEALCDGSTVYPDHIAGHLTAALVLAALIAREHTGRGARIEVAQADTALNQIAISLAAESLEPGSVRPLGNADRCAAPSGVFECAGDDEWCAVTVGTDDQWAALCRLAGRDELIDDARLATAAARLRHREQAEEVLARWITGYSPRRAAELLQEAGIAAGPMIRLPELLSDPQLIRQNSYTTIGHPLLTGELPATARAAVFAEIADPPRRPAPLAGEHTREIAAQRLGLADEQIEALVADGVLQPAT